VQIAERAAARFKPTKEGGERFSVLARNIRPAADARADNRNTSLIWDRSEKPSRLRGRDDDTADDISSSEKGRHQIHGTTVPTLSLSCRARNGLKEETNVSKHNKRT